MARGLDCEQTLMERIDALCYVYGKVINDQPREKNMEDVKLTDLSVSLPDAEHARDEQWYENLWKVSFLTLALAIFLIAWSYSFAGNPEVWAKILNLTLKEAGFACLVTFFLNITVEAINRRRHAKEGAALARRVDSNHEKRIQALLADLQKKHSETSSALFRDVFKTVYLRNIPEGVFEVIDNHILKRDLIRREYKCSLTIDPIPSDSSLVALTFQTRFHLCNISDHLFSGKIVDVSIDVPPSHQDTCRFHELRFGDRVYRGKELDELASLDNDSDLLSVVLTGDVKSGETKFVYIKYTKVAPRNNSEAICSTQPMDSLECDALIQVDGLAISASSLHPEPEEITSAPDRGRFKSWRIKHAILPGQGIVLYWHPKKIVDQHRVRDEAPAEPDQPEQLVRQATNHPPV